MLTTTEMDILFSVAQYAQIKGEYLSNISARIIPKDDNKTYSFEDLHSEKFPITKDLFANWTQKNQTQIPFLEIEERIIIKFYLMENLDSLINAEENKWSVFYSITQPGISNNGYSALVQLAAYCPSGPPNYGSIFLLEKSGQEWSVKYNYGLYNQ